MWRFVFSAICLIGPGIADGADEDGIERGQPEGKPRLVLQTGGHTAQVRALAFSPDGRRLYSGGLDKIVIGWDIQQQKKGRFLTSSIDLVQTLHWEISRGMRGTIMELAVPAVVGPPRWLAIGGYSARGHGGDVTIYDAAAARVKRTVTDLEGSLATGGLAFSPDGAKLAAVSVYGDTWLWSIPDFTPTKLRPFETDQDGNKLDRSYRALAFLDDHTLAAAIPFGPPGGDQWNIALYDLRRPDRPLVLRTAHQGAITAIAREPNAVDAKNLRWATASKGGEIFLWTGRAEQQPVRLPTEREPLDVAFGPGGSFFVATRLLPQKEQPGVEAAYLEHWRLDPPRLVEDYVTSTHLDNYACTVSPDGRWLATAGDDNAPVIVFPLYDAKEQLAEKPLNGGGQRPLQPRGEGTAMGHVAFAITEKGEYQIGFGPVEQSGRAQDFNKYGSTQQVFDLSGGRLLSEDGGPRAFTSPEHDDWTVTTENNRRRLRLTSKAGKRCTITLDPSTQGEAICYCFLEEGSAAYAVAVGTNHQNGVFIYELVKDGQCPLLRYSRDHISVVTSLSVSHDRQYLASASLDQTVKIWSLDGLRSLTREIEPSRQGGFKNAAAWGATFEIVDENLVAKDVKPAGIAFARGLRDGDILDTLARVEGGEAREHHGPEPILAALNAATVFEQLTIKVRRGDQVQELPQTVPAWEPVATLYVDRGGEWALFTPQGPYQTSVKSDQFFGWQLNMGPDHTPEFRMAEELRGELERPEVLLNLFRSSAENIQSQLTELATHGDFVHPAAIRTPLVRILSPRDGDEVDAKEILVEARIYYPPGTVPAGCNVFAQLNGGDIGLPQERWIESREWRTERIKWSTPAYEPRNRLTVQVQRQGAPLTAPFDTHSVNFDADVTQKQPRLHLLVMAADAYAGRGLELPYPVRDADSLVEVLRSQSKELYEPGEYFRLVNHEISPTRTPAEIEEIAATLRKKAQPGDVLIVYIAGHGASYDKKYYFVPPAQDLALDDSGRSLVEQIGVAWDCLLPLRQTPCRKLVFLDTCHSGNAVLQNDSLGHHKAMSRPLRQAEMLIVSASSVGQEARGSPEKGGFFTAALRDGLAGFADGFAGDVNQSGNPPDQEVELLELVRYVTAEVPERTRTIKLHTPMHSPEQLFKALHIPLTRYDPATLRRAPLAVPPAAAAAVGAATPSSIPAAAPPQ